MSATATSMETASLWMNASVFFDPLVMCKKYPIAVEVLKGVMI